MTTHHITFKIYFIATVIGTGYRGGSRTI